MPLDLEPVLDLEPALDLDPVHEEQPKLEKTYLSQLAVKVPEVIQDWKLDFPNEIQGLSEKETGLLNSLKKDIVLKEATRRIKESPAQSAARAGVQFTADALQSLSSPENVGIAAVTAVSPTAGAGIMAGLAAKAIGEGSGTLSVPGIGVGEATKEILNMGAMTLGALGAAKLALKPVETIAKSGAPETAKALQNTLETFKEKGLENASEISKTAEVHGDVQPQPIESTEQVPAPEGSGGIQPQTESGIPNAPSGGPEVKPDLSGPGSPSIDQGPDPKAAIESLEESFRNIKGPKPSVGDQVKEAFNLGDKLSQAKDAISSGVQALKSSGDFIIKKWEGIPEIDEMLRAKGELSAEIEKRGWRVRQFVKTVENAMPTTKQRAAVLKWVDAGGDIAELQRGLSETPERYKQAYQDAIDLKGDDLIAAKNIRSYFEERLDDAINAGVLEEGVSDYIHRLYERDPKVRDKALAYVQSGVLQQNPALAKKRVFQFDWEAEKAGLNPIQDFLPRIAQYEASLSKAIAARKFVREMTGYVEGEKKVPGMKAEDGRPVLDVAGLGVPIENAEGVREATLIKPSFKPGEQKGPKENRSDYVERDYPALRKWKWLAGDAEGKPILVQGNLLIHPDMVGRIDALLEPSKVRYGRYPKLGKAALGVSSTIKQTMLDLSGFHQVQITIHGMEHKVMPWKILNEIDFNNPNVDGLLKGGITLGGEYYSAHHGEGLVGSALTRHVPILGPLMESYHNWLFQSYIPRIKMSMALNALERNRARYGGIQKVEKVPSGKTEIRTGTMTDEQIFNKTASEANSAFGELNYTMLERSRTARDISRIIMLAPDFLEARSRFAGGALEKGGKLGGQEQRAALLLGALTMYITARVANKMISDEYHFEPENAFSVVADGHSYSLRTVQGDIMHLIDEPLNFWMHRLNPVFGKPALQIASGRDEFGRKRSVAETLWDTAKNTVPISLRSSRERTLWESMANSFGLTTRRWNDVDKAFKLAAGWKKEHGVQERGEFIYDPDKDPLRNLKIALSRNNDEDAAKEIKKLIDSGVITRKKLRDYFKRYASMPFTGSRKNDRDWMETLTEDQLKIVEGAQAHKQSIRDLFEEALAKSGM